MFELHEQLPSMRCLESYVEIDARHAFIVVKQIGTHVNRVDMYKCTVRTRLIRKVAEAMFWAPEPANVAVTVNL